MNKTLPWSWTRLSHGYEQDFSHGHEQDLPMVMRKTFHMVMNKNFPWSWARLSYGHEQDFSHGHEQDFPMVLNKTFPWSWTRLSHGHEQDFSNGHEQDSPMVMEKIFLDHRQNFPISMHIKQWSRSELSNGQEPNFPVIITITNQPSGSELYIGQASITVQ